MILNEILDDAKVRDALDKVKGMISGNCVIVYGCGPSLERNVKEIKRVGLDKTCVNVAVDGATSALLKEGIKPGLIVTDLDGKIEDILSANLEGSIVVVHAHGDNITSLEKVKEFHGPVLGTTQTEPIGKIYNFFGFTDGDRAAFLSEAMGAHTILLAGFDLGEKVGRFSKPTYTCDVYATTVKRKKLKYAKKLLEWLAKNTDAVIVNITGKGEVIKGVKTLRWV